MFPEDLPGLPPDREIEFVIVLVAGTAPILKAISDGSERIKGVESPITRIIGQ